MFTGLPRLFASSFCRDEVHASAVVCCDGPWCPILILNGHSRLRVGDVTIFAILASFHRAHDVSRLHGCSINTHIKRRRCSRFRALLMPSLFDQSIKLSSKGVRASGLLLLTETVQNSRLTNRASLSMTIRLLPGGLLGFGRAGSLTAVFVCLRVAGLTFGWNA